MSISPGLPLANVLGVQFIAARRRDVVDAVRDVLAGAARDSAYLCPTGVHGVIEARKDPRFRRILNQATFNVADGQPIVFLSRYQGMHRTERAFGPDLMSLIIEASIPLGTRHFFYGGREGVAEALAERLTERFPGLVVAGHYCPPFRPLAGEERLDIAAAINDSAADAVWVGLSTPKQERWIHDMRSLLHVKLLCSVGAAFDYHTGTVQKAPKWMQRLALEWLYRLIQEPRRLWRRYAEIVPTFLLLAMLQVSGVRRFPVDD